MANLARWDPLRDTLSLRDAMDQLFEESFVRPRSWPATGAGGGALALDVRETDDDLTVRASVPGVDPDDIDISISDGTLTIKGETQKEKEEKEGSYHLRERRYGAFRRTIGLPTMVNANKAEAEYKDGVLTLTLPKAEEVKPKSINIKTK
jgi:HSP20 family protein